MVARGNAEEQGLVRDQVVFVFGDGYERAATTVYNTQYTTASEL